MLALLCTEAPRKVVEHNGKMLCCDGRTVLATGYPSPALTNIACLRLDRRLTGFAESQGWRYTRYADDLTFSVPIGRHTGRQYVDGFIAKVTEIVADEGFNIHPDKTTVMGLGNRQEVTGLVVNGESTPRTPREVKRMLRAAIHNLKNGHPFKEGESLQTLLGYAAFVCSQEPEQGREFLDELSTLPVGVGTESFLAQQQ